MVERGSADANADVTAADQLWYRQIVANFDAI
jgi:hypothetical protein